MSKNSIGALKGLRGKLDPKDFEGIAPDGVHCWPGLTKPAIAIYRGGASPKSVAQINGEFTPNGGPAAGVPCVGHGLGYAVPGLTDASGIVQLGLNVPVLLPPALALILAIDISSVKSWPVGPATVINPVSGKAMAGRQVIDLYIHPDDLGQPPNQETGEPATGLFQMLATKEGWGGLQPDAKWRQAISVMTIRSTVDGSILLAPATQEFNRAEAEVDVLRDQVQELQAKLDEAATMRGELQELRGLVAQLSAARGESGMYAEPEDEGGTVPVVLDENGELVAPEVKPRAKASK